MQLIVHRLTDDMTGTWVPLERAKEIAALYNVGELLKPIFEFRPSTESPPLAPKHVTAASTKPRPARAPARAAPAAPVKRVASKFRICCDVILFGKKTLIPLFKQNLHHPYQYQCHHLMSVQKRTQARMTI